VCRRTKRETRAGERDEAIAWLDTTVARKACQELLESRYLLKLNRTMTRKAHVLRRSLAAIAMLCSLLMTARAFAGIRSIAVVASAGSKLSDVQLADLTKLCKGVQKTWPDGKNFTLVMKDPESPDMSAVAQKLFGVPLGEIKTLIGKRNESRVTVNIVRSDEELLRTVEATPGAVGIIDVYAINSSVKVLRIDGKLPFDLGYALKGN
jgi:hypothetical protein